MRTPDRTSPMHGADAPLAIRPMIGAVLSAVVLAVAVVGAARGVTPAPIAIASSAMAGFGLMQFLVTLAAGAGGTNMRERLIAGGLAAFVGGVLAMLGGLLDPGRQIQPDEYGYIARTVERQPYAAPLLARARADGIVTNAERDAFYEDLQALERDRVLKGITTKGKTNG